MSVRLSVLSSMATRALLEDLLADFSAHSGCAVALESVGGVDAARRVAAGESFDVVVLAADAIDRLRAAGQLHGERVELAHSPVAVAVRAGAPRPDIGSADALRQAVQMARTLGCSTGPSGVALRRLFARWGLADTLTARIVTPPPGTPVGQWVAEGRIELGFQQLSELQDLPGIEVLGVLPDEVAIVTPFAAALGQAAAADGPAAALLRHLAAPAGAALKRRHGMRAA